MKRNPVIIVFLVLGLALAFAGCGGSSKIQELEPTAAPTATNNVQSRITGVTVTSGTVVVTFTLFDEKGNELDPVAMLADTSLGSNRCRFYLGRIEADNNYVNYCNGSQTTTGTPSYDKSSPASSHFAKVGTGTFTYTFYTNIDNASQTLNGIRVTGSEGKTHTAAIQIVRNWTTDTGKAFQQAVNPYFNFRPDGAAVTVTREVVSISACNECHGVLGLHGGGRREIALCILCHYPGVLDPTTGNSIDMKSMVHKIHYGVKLPSNVAGGDFTIGSSSFKTVAYPFISGDSNVGETPAYCVKCHVLGKDYAGNSYGKNVNNWKTGPTYAKCTTCHDTLTFDGSATIVVKIGATDCTVTAQRHDLLAATTIDVTGANATNTAICTPCHDVALFANSEYTSASIPGSHTILEKSSIFTGINFQIVRVDNATAGNRPVVTWKATTDNGASLNPAASGTSFNIKLGFMAAGVPDYNINNISNNTTAQPFSKALAASTANADGSFTATFDNAIPAGTTGVAVVGLEGRVTYSLTGTRTGETKRVGGQSVQYYFDPATGVQVTDPTLQRRVRVDAARCNKCHDRLSFHGSNRVNNTQECVICHNPNAAISTDNTAGIDLMYMVHIIHTGDERAATAPPYPFGAEVRYPNDRRNCLACHVDTTPISYGIPLVAGALGTIDNNADLYASASTLRINPIRAVCMSCHSDEDTYATALPHVISQTTGSTTELCAQCHTSGLLLGPDVAHEAVR